MDKSGSEEPPRKRQRRQATVYDAVAGRVQSRGFLPTQPYTSRTRDLAVVSSVPVPPEEVLFRRKHAPTRYEEDDIYFQERHLPAHVKLPDSDLLKAVHAYASDFYGSLEQQEHAAGAGVGRGKRRQKHLGDWESMDETALLAVGILLEEAAADALGKTGHLALLQREDEEKTEVPLAWDGSKWVKSVLRKPRERFTDATETEGETASVEDAELEEAEDTDEIPVHVPDALREHRIADARSTEESSDDDAEDEDEDEDEAGDMRNVGSSSDSEASGSTEESSDGG